MAMQAISQVKKRHYWQWPAVEAMAVELPLQVREPIQTIPTIHQMDTTKQIATTTQTATATIVQTQMQITTTQRVLMPTPITMLEAAGIHQKIVQTAGGQQTLI